VIAVVRASVRHCRLRLIVILEEIMMLDMSHLSETLTETLSLSLSHTHTYVTTYTNVLQNDKHD
jgi:phosphopantetheinyl transferase (holo-ACP synthase)